MNYKKTIINDIEIIIVQLEGKTMSIPADPANTDYQAYLAWVAEGNTAEEWNPEETE